MTQESPTSNREGAIESENSSARATGAPARIVAGKRNLPPGSSDKYPLPGRWPQPEAWPESGDLLEIEAEPEPVAAAAPQPKAVAEPPVEQPVMIEIEIGSRFPAVKRSNWLEAPDYWLADHQSVPRPPTRPIPRPRRFVRMSRARSTMLLLVAVVGIVVVGAGMAFAGHLTYEYFNTPLALPTAHRDGYPGNRHADGHPGDSYRDRRHRQPGNRHACHYAGYDPGYHAGHFHTLTIEVAP
jgi:hypothetical protein